MSQTENAVTHVGGWERWRAYRDAHGGRLRIGQAWFNLLPAEDMERLRGHVLDPFYRDDWDSVFAALKFLRDTPRG